MLEPLQEMFIRSRILVLDFSKIPKNIDMELDIRQYFVGCEQSGENPRLPVNRQKFNDMSLAKTGSRYLVGQYGEDRAAMLADTPAGQEGRTIHMGIDIFASNLESVRAPFSGKIIRSSHEEGFGEYGNYLILQPENQDYYVFMGHLSNDRASSGPVTSGQIIGRLGDYTDNENGGWSRHLHLQILKALPPEGSTPDGYSTNKDFVKNSLIYPSPMDYFPAFKLA